jgi:hypothetical protein
MLQSRYVDIRRFLRDNTKIHKLWNIGDGVFGARVTAPCSIFIAEKQKPNINHKVSFLDTRALKNNEQRTEAAETPNYHRIKQLDYKKTVEETFVIFYRELKENEVLLEQVLECKDCGIKQQRVGVGLEAKGKSNLTERLFYEGKKQNDCDKQYLRGADLDREGWYIEVKNKRYFRGDYKDRLKKNEIVYFNEDVFNLKEKIIWRQTSDRIRATIVGRAWFANTLQVGILKDTKYDLKYVLALLNSKFLNYIYIETVKEEGRVFPQVKMGKVKTLPFRTLDLSKKSDRQAHDNIVALVDKVLILNELEHKEINDHKKNLIGQQINGICKAIDTMVYELYGLTEEEISMVENK